MSTLAEKIAVMQAAADGKDIEYRNISAGLWAPASTPQWNWTSKDYRVKPAEPLIIWVPERGGVVAAGRRTSDNKKPSEILSSGWEWKKFKQVIPDNDIT